MGYTHYYYQSRSFDKREWEQIRKDVETIIEDCIANNITLVQEYDDHKPPIVNSKRVFFNGKADEGHETFVVDRTPQYRSYDNKNEPLFQFCKTARKPYDMAVGLCLLRIRAIAPTAITVSSDGRWDNDQEWVPIRNKYKELFGEEAEAFK